ncbi:MAG: hypothetical protein KatS3mg111_4217 [Pirellulaceae bacterium]|nr:MAG: hypothetical protein KatS3mg111_4217 [Pirellulaceae bacterium]
MNPLIDPHENPQAAIDALVLGELRDASYRQMLEWLEAHPEFWRDCALAFLEEQALAQELQAIAALQQDATKPTITEDVPETKPAVSPAANTQTVSPVSAVPLRTVERWTVLAATLLIGLTAGWKVPVWFSQLAPERSAKASPARSELVANLSESPRPDAQLTSEAVRGGERRSPRRAPAATIAGHSSEASSDNLDAPLEAPLQRYASSDQIVPLPSAPPQILRALEEQGLIGMECEQSLMLMELEEGDKALVPVQRLRIEPNIFSY